MTRSHRLCSSLALALGLAAFGCGGTPTTSGDTSPAHEEGPPKVQVRGDDTINAGEVDFGLPRDFSFTIANVGYSPLELQLTRKSCSCADVKLPPGPIEPGKEGRVNVKWTPIAGFTGAYTLTIDLRTNDPGKKALRLSVQGQIQPLVHVLVEGRETDPYGEFSVDFGDQPITPGEPRTREVKVFSTRLDQFKLQATSTVPGFDIKAPEPLPAGAPVGNYDSVQSGYKLEITTTKDLPLGYVRGLLNLALSDLGEKEPNRVIPLPLLAVVGQGVVTVTPSMLLFSKSSIADGDTTRVHVTYIKPPAKEEVTVESVEPSFVTVDKPERGLDGNWRIIAHLPKDNAGAAAWQADPPLIGKVVLKVAGLERPLIVEVKWDPKPVPEAKPKPKPTN
jgi:hypothetical protein